MVELTRFGEMWSVLVIEFCFLFPTSIDLILWNELYCQPIHKEIVKRHMFSFTLHQQMNEIFTEILGI